MMIHLESGSCESGIDAQEINRLAARCYQWKKYIVPNYRVWMLNGMDRQVREYCYQCPDTDCNVRFKTLSGLLQHAETDRCNEGVFDNRVGSLTKLLIFIYNCL